MRIFYDTEFNEDGRTIELISIGLVTEDLRTYYAENADFDPTQANAWVKEHVLPHLSEGYRMPYREIGPNIKSWIEEWLGVEKPEFWGWYSAYDHVALCQLFGRMVDLPEGWPYFTRDLRQLADLVGNPKMPEQSQKEHHALHDAFWIREAHRYVTSLFTPERVFGLNPNAAARAAARSRRPGSPGQTPAAAW
jgi:hypothetical protein